MRLRPTIEWGLRPGVSLRPAIDRGLCRGIRLRPTSGNCVLG